MFLSHLHAIKLSMVSMEVREGFRNPSHGKILLGGRYTGKIGQYLLCLFDLSRQISIGKKKEEW